jgi:mono/diheme cytochrome c family protein
MLGTTVWMFVDDYNRDFKAVQRTFRDVEATLAEREMLEKVPSTEDVKEQADKVKEARAARDEARKKVQDKDRSLTARRERQTAVYQGIKADYDSLMTYYNIDAEHWANAPDGSSEKDRLARARDEKKKRLDELEKELTDAKARLDKIESEYRQDVTSPLDEPEKELAQEEANLKKVTTDFDRAAKLAAQKSWSAGDIFRNLPIIDGFAAPTKINQIWLPDLTIDYGGFKEVPRYDRCTTCHLGIDKAAYDKATLVRLGDPDVRRELTRNLSAAKEILEGRQKSGENLGFDPNDLPSQRDWAVPGLTAALVFTLAVLLAVGLGFMRGSLGLGVNVALAGLALTLVAGGVAAYFAPRKTVIRDVKLTEGQVTQYAAHPRLDLFVDANSPHSMEKFGCTTCHAGQGSATDFQLSAHTPADVRQKEKWEKEYHWHASHFWDFPMLSNRFVESSCVKCHHQMTDLTREGNKEEAPKLLRGYNLVKENGCFGCHEISAVKGGRRVGPDLRLEPQPALDYLSAAEQEKAKADQANPPGTERKVGPSLRRLAEKTNREWARKWIFAPRDFRPDTRMPHFYGLSTNNEAFLKENAPEQAKFPATEIHGIAYYLFAESGKFLEGDETTRHTLLAGHAYPDETGNLKELQNRLKGNVLADKDMKALHDVSKRFGDLALLSAPGSAKGINADLQQQRQLQDRIQELQKKKLDLGAQEEPKELDAADKAELADLARQLDEVTDRLIKEARPVPLSKQVVNEDGAPVTLPAKGNAESGRRLFSERGCLACHSHEGTTQPGAPAIHGIANHGPELSRIAAKLKPEAKGVEGRRWLIQWLLNPNVYHPRTRMPVTFLTPAQAADVAEWLLSQKTDWQGKDPEGPSLQDLVNLARVYLGKTPGISRPDLDQFLPADAEKIKEAGIPKDRLKDLPPEVDEHRLAAPVTRTKLLWYIGRKGITRQGCYGCHDIPGFETAKPIGTALNDWGRKDTERLAFEDAGAFVREHFNIVPTRRTKKDVEERIKALESEEAARKLEPAESKELRDLRKRLDAQPRIRELMLKSQGEGLTDKEKQELARLEPLKLWEKEGDKEPYEELFFQSLEHHGREGFLHQKLLEPRSYDYNRIKAWEDRLRMPQFKFARLRKNAGEADEDFAARQEKAEAEAREAVMTFILGLVAEPIPLQYVSTPRADRGAEVAGRKVLDKYNCGGCHQVRPGVFEFKASEDNRKALEDSLGNVGGGSGNPNFKSDYFFLEHNAWFGPAPTSDRLSAFGYHNPKITENPLEEGKKVFAIHLTEALRFNGRDKVQRDIPAASDIIVPDGAVQRQTEPFGGTLADLLVPYLEKQYPDLYGGKPDNARSVLPPPLTREGERVQPDWLYRFLLNPPPIRPTSYMMLRMPRFNMSPEESRALVNYFAAVSKTTNPGAGVTYPYVAIDQRDDDYWVRQTKRYVQRLKDAKKLDERLKEMKPIWEAAVKKELAEAEAALPAAKKAVEEAKAKSAPDAADREKAQKALEERIKGLKDRMEKGDFSGRRQRWESREAYAADAFRLLTNRDLCLKCHSVGKLEIEGPQGPNLALSAERLRPEWTEQWIAHPRRLFTYTPVMPQNFPNEPDPLKWQWQQFFVGSPRDQVRAVRDVLMDLPRLADLPANQNPPAPAAGGGK